MHTASLVLGLLSLFFAFIGFIPFLGWINWFVILATTLGCILGLLGGGIRRPGFWINVVVWNLSVFRLIIGGGII